MKEPGISGYNSYIYKGTLHVIIGKQAGVKNRIGIGVKNRIGQREKYKKIKDCPGISFLYIPKMKKALMTFTEDGRPDGA